MHPTNSDATPLTSFDPATADAVVVVLGRAGISAWQASEPDEHGDVVVLVPAASRADAMREMGQRMDEISAEVRGAPGRAHLDGEVEDRDDRDDLRDGPPLTMERFADLRLVVLVVLLPLLVTTIAGPFLPRQARIVIFALLAVGLAVAFGLRRR